MTRERMTLERERVVSVDWATGFGFGSTITAIAVPSLMRYDVFSDDHRCHVADWMRTRVTPGADPRAECEPFDWRMTRYLLTQRPRAIAEIRGDDGRVRCVVMDNPRARVDRVVPEDVARWRDPKHRAAMTERAREYASHLPGRRA